MRGFKKRKEVKSKREKKPRWLAVPIDNACRRAGVVAGLPGSGKTTFLRVLSRYTDIMISVKESHLPRESTAVPEEVVVRISAVLYFTA